jgi:ATP-dependent protease Clp ATPase subunit
MAGPELHCTFCGKSADEVRQLIVGPSVYICNECLQIMRELFDAALQVKHSGVRRAHLPGVPRSAVSAHPRPFPQGHGVLADA